MNKTDATIEAALAAAGQKATVTGASITGVGWVFTNEFLGLAGLLVAVFGLLVNIYFKRKEDQRQEREHVAAMAAIRGQSYGDE